MTQPMRSIEFVEHPDVELARDVAKFYDDPLGHVRYSYPWGVEGTALEGWTGPDKWQIEFLTELGEEVRKRGFDGVHAVDPIQFSTASGHGIGKSTMTAWIIRWIMDTRPFSRGVVTATTSDQLRTKSWSELAKWHHMGITRHWYALNSGAGSLNIYHRNHRETWRCDAQTCEERNSEAFAGLHNAASTAYYIFDEAAGVPAKIWEVREGGLTDGEPMTFDWGNPTRNSGRFFENMQGRLRDRYIRRYIDSRTVSVTNKAYLQRLIDDYGITSDVVKVRVLGQFPSAGSLQFISGDDVDACINLDVVVTPYDPVVLGVDVARFGDDHSCIFPRHGRDAESRGLFRYQGLDTMQLAAQVAEKARLLNPDAIFIDGGGVGGGVVDRCQQLGLDVIEINFASKATQPGFANMRAQCWGNMRDAIKAGIRLPDDPDMRSDLTGLEYGYNGHNDLLLERKEDAKKRGIASPDDADALSLSYAFPVAQNRPGYQGVSTQPQPNDYDPFA
jgi:hypothetical protein